ncbi:NH(3)-dependent NAD(+) synthetase [Desulfosarcina ovata subsp. sediminis]|uniref:NH(3)-dependent NAD(+) synthetase n=1 Tax=Desulfosarcina ovata subsp. sediminis TaxID=885957 RepID=A0A5K7ZGM4_9BACT|nr:NAD(+) synthase [Desulfosarcina ovata]BBO81348.1 NH(3)-dependent NAD(+) synthetase [Desulfosarcina ovata subsp. sediminis]
MTQSFSKDILTIDAGKEADKIGNQIRMLLTRKLKRRGLVVALSGGIDSSVSVGLAAKALGPERVVALLMPERHSSDDTLDLSKSVAETFGVKWFHEDISGVLEAVGFYRRYDDAVSKAIPEYGDGWKSKIVIPNVMESKGFNLFSIVAQRPDGTQVQKRLPLEAYLEIVAATNFKQRTRKMFEYYYADRFNYAVVGTPNRLEYDQGFFVKLGDGAADIKPIAHLYKSQVYQMAAFLGVPEKIRNRPPTTDTYSMPQGQDEFYFSLPYDRMDLCLYGKNNGYAPTDIANTLGLTPDQVQRVYDDIDTKRVTTRYLHLMPQLIEDVPEIKE